MVISAPVSSWRLKEQDGQGRLEPNVSPNRCAALIIYLTGEVERVGMPVLYKDHTWGCESQIRRHKYLLDWVASLLDASYLMLHVETEMLGKVPKCKLLLVQSEEKRTSH